MAINSRRSPTLLAIGLLAILYFVVGSFCLRLAFLNASASPVWPTAGIALAALLLLGHRVWPGVLIGAFLVNITTAGNPGTSLFIAVGNTLEALCGAWLVNRFAGGIRAFDRAQDVFKFALAVMVSALISASIGVTTLALAGFANWANYGAIWLTWWSGDTTGILIVAPLIILWGRAAESRWTRREGIEIIALLILMTLLGEAVFGGWFPNSALNYPIAFILGPILIWTAFRFSQRETATGFFILCIIAIWGTLRHRGPFIMETENQSLVILQSSTALLFITAMALAAAMAERRRAEEALESQKIAVEAANKSKDYFLAMLSHELRTPLTPVLAELDVLEFDGASADSKAALATIRRNVELESQLIDDLLDLTRITRDKLQLTLVPVDAHQAISDVVEICREELSTRKLQLEINLRAEEHYISADAAKFQQIVWNLLKNAIKFTGEEGQIGISTANPSPHTLAITVRDTGVGIESDLLDRIFEPFEQGAQSFQKRLGGLGLGLAISRSLAEAHGGTLVAKSDGRDFGSTFLLTMQTTVPNERSSSDAGQDDQTQRRIGLRILLVDDHTDTCVALEKLLVHRGHLVATANSMRSAMEVAVPNRFDLLISDIALSDGSGIDLMMQLHRICGIPGIAISGFGMKGDIERSLQAGFVEHLVKPVKLEKLEAAINRVTKGGMSG